MGLLQRIRPIVDDLRTARGLVDQALIDITYTHDRAVIATQLREAAQKADAAATKARDTARAIEAGFGTLPESLTAPEPAPGVQEDDDDGA